MGWFGGSGGRFCDDLLLLLRALAERQREQVALRWAFVGLGVAMAVFALSLPLWALFAGATLFFLAFNVLEAAMPSLVSRLSAASGRGKKMGVYTTFQFLGAFAGGALGGWLLEHTNSTTTLWAATAISLLWSVLPRPSRQASA